MALIKVRDLAWARMRAPDLDAMEEFLTHFGLTRAARTPTALYMRGTDPAHHIHVTEKADDAGFVGFAYHAASEDDLARVAKAPGASAVETIDEPGGGKRVRLREPNGYQIEVDLGHRGAAADPGAAHADEHRRRAPAPRGDPDAAAQVADPDQAHRPRGARARRRSARPCSGSATRSASSARTTSTPAQKDNLIGSFNRCDRGRRVRRPPHAVLRARTSGRA